MDQVIYNEYFELIYFMKKKDGYLTDEEYMIFQYMFELRKSKMNEEEMDKLKKKTEYLNQLLDDYYESL